MQLTDFDFDLPPELIAQAPVAERDRSRLLVVDRKTARREHRSFAELPEVLAPGDLLVFNDTKVIPARLFATKPTGGEVELLLTKPREGAPATFEAMVRPAKRVKVGARLVVADGFTLEVRASLGDGFFEVALETADVWAALEQHGHIPLPPYISRGDAESDRANYQTIFADRPGSAAAPTAGLHFTPRLLQALAARGVETTRLTLHVGPGTFLPVREEGDLRKHKMHSEWFELPAAAIAAVQATKARGGRVVAVGTTTVRTLESVFAQRGRLEAMRGETDIFIYPGFDFRVVDAMVTNFHLPRSTLLMLVSAFAGLEGVRAAYAEAVRERYRFFSYGDACLFV